jgi:uncharacterized protein YndB with AHSA1/START domain
MSGDRARVSVRVDVAADDAFRIFTEEIDLWWRRGAKFRHAGARKGIVAIEPREGGRVFESVDGDPPIVIEIGVVQAWDPPRRLAFSWRNANFAPGEWTLVEVDFAPQREATLVTVTHRGWATLRDDHPARHGLAGVAFSRMIAAWWGDQMASLRLTARADRRPAP